MSERIYVGNLPLSATEAELDELFSSIGPIVSLKLIRDPNTGVSKGFAFIEMASAEDATKVINEFHEHQLGGRFIVVCIAEPLGARKNRAARRRGGPAAKGRGESLPVNRRTGGA